LKFTLNACNSVATNALAPLARLLQLLSAVGLLGRTGSSSFGSFVDGAARTDPRSHRLCPLPPWTWATASASALASAPGPASASLFPSRLHVGETLHQGALGVATATTAPLDVGDNREQFFGGLDQAEQVAGLRRSGVGVAGRGRHSS